MTQPSECKYCRCDKFNADSVTMTRFRCGSSYWPQDEVWQIANGCAAKCAVQLVELRGRIKRAVDVLEGAARYRVEKDKYGTYMQSGINGGWLDVIEVEQVIEILKGETDGKAN